MRLVQCVLGSSLALLVAGCNSSGSSGPEATDGAAGESADSEAGVATGSGGGSAVGTSSGAGAPGSGGSSGDTEAASSVGGSSADGTSSAAGGTGDTGGTGGNSNTTTGSTEGTNSSTGVTGSTGAGGTGGGTGIVCNPGSTQLCLGPGACTGAQACTEAGNGWGACDCGNTTTTSGTSSATNATSTSSTLASTTAASTTTATTGGTVEPCNGIVNVGPAVYEEELIAVPPTMTGGVITDGTYVLTSRFDFTGSCDCYHSITVVVSGGGTHLEWMYDTTPENYDITTTGSVLTMNQTCPAVQTTLYGYTATATTIWIFDPIDEHLDELTRQ